MSEAGWALSASARCRRHCLGGSPERSVEPIGLPSSMKTVRQAGPRFCRSAQKADTADRYGRRMDRNRRRPTEPRSVVSEGFSGKRRLRRSAPLRSVRWRSAFEKSAPRRLALRKLASRSTALAKSASERSANLRSAPTTRAPERLALLRSAPARLVSTSFAPDKSAAARLVFTAPTVPARSAPASFAPGA
jgi:hypothetical protein